MCCLEPPGLALCCCCCCCCLLGRRDLPLARLGLALRLCNLLPLRRQLLLRRRDSSLMLLGLLLGLALRSLGLLMGLVDVALKPLDLVSLGCQLPLRCLN